MRVGIMQPYFFPYWGHFALIARCDAWVVFDITQFTPKSWMSRNRVLHPERGWSWIHVPLSNNSIHIRTYEARLLDPDGALKTIQGKLSHYRRHAPYYWVVDDLVREAFAETRGDRSLTRLNVATLSAVCRCLDLPFRPLVCSESTLNLPSGLGAGDWALEIATRLGAIQYLNPASGAALFDPMSFAGRGIELQFLHACGWEYETPGREFVADLSILDALMWNDTVEVRRALLAHSRVASAPVLLQPA